VLRASRQKAFVNERPRRMGPGVRRDDVRKNARGCAFDNPTGKSMRESEKSKSSPDAKNILIFRIPKSLL
jgi:hypothetical protein